MNVLDPLNESLVILGFRHLKNFLGRSDSRLKQLESSVVRLGSEELVDERLQDLVIELVINFASKDTLTDESAKGVPRNLVGVDVRTVLTHRVNPLVNAVKCAALVTFIELVNL